MRRKISIIAILLVLVCMFTACGAPAEKSQKELTADLQQSAVFQSEREAQLSISSIEIEKRRTDKEAGVDTIYLWAEVESEVATGRVGYVMQYVLYDEGWILEEVTSYEPQSWAFTPLTGVSQSRADADILEEEAALQWQFVSADTDLEQGICYYNYVAEETIYENFCNMRHAASVEYVFDTMVGEWELVRVNDHGFADWSYLAGTWQTSAAVKLWTLHGHPQRTAQVDLTLVIDDVTATDFHAVVYHQDAVVYDDRVELESYGFKEFKFPLKVTDSNGDKVDLKEGIWLVLPRDESIEFSDDAFSLFVKQ